MRQPKLRFRLKPRIARPEAEAVTDTWLRGLGIPQSEWREPSLALQDTPLRIAKMMRDEMLSSYKPGAYEALCRKFTTFPSDGQDAMVHLGNIDFASQCSHHLLPFVGKAYVAYIPGERVIGASKAARVVEYYSHMLQIQERLTRQIADFIYEKAEARLVICLVDAVHYCMRMRGVKQPNNRMITTAIRPDPSEDQGESFRGVINEFYQQMSLIRSE